MDKPKTNYIIDLLALIFFAIVSLSGLAIKFFMPSTVRQGRLQEFLGIQKEVWSEIHESAGILLIILILIHFIVHWDWIASMTKKIFQPHKSELKNSKIN